MGRRKEPPAVELPTPASIALTATPCPTSRMADTVADLADRITIMLLCEPVHRREQHMTRLEQLRDETLAVLAVIEGTPAALTEMDARTVN